MAKEIITTRLNRMFDLVAASDFDAAAVIPGANFAYLTGVNFHLMERPTILLVTGDGKLTAIMPVLERTKWEGAELPVDTIYWQDSDGFDAAFDDAASRVPGLGRLGVEGQQMRFFEGQALRRAFSNTDVVDAHQEISAVRLYKDAAEIAAMEKAIAISEAALAETIAWVAPGMSEAEVRAKLIVTMMEKGAEGLAFQPIVLTGGASADCHGEPSHERRLARGDALLFDFGALYQGYNADITRTFFVGEVSDRHRDVYQAVKAANEHGRTVAEPGMSAHDLDTAVTGVLRDSGFGNMIVHKTGHGLGLDVHEAPQVMIGNQAKLETGMVFTIEPGLYRDNEVGVRIEDDVVVTDNGARSLTAFDRDLTIVG